MTFPIIREKYFLIGVFPLFILSLIFIVLGSYGIENATSNLQNRMNDLTKARKENIEKKQINEMKKSLDEARYSRSLYIFMLTCAAIMVVHAMVIVLSKVKNRWISAYGTMSATLIVLGVLRKFNNIGLRGTNNLYIAIGSVLTFVMFVLAASQGNIQGSDKNFNDYDDEE